MTPRDASGDIAGVYADVASFIPGQVVTITVLAEDDDGVLIITSSQEDSQLTVVNCTGNGSNQVAGKCDGRGMAAVSNQGTKTLLVDTTVLDTDTEREVMVVTLTLLATCDEETAVTIGAHQPGKVGPDNVTIHCRPATPTPTPSPTSTPSPTPTSTPPPTATVAPPPPTSTPVQQVSTPVQQVSTTIRPPSTGEAGLR